MTKGKIFSAVGYLEEQLKEANLEIEVLKGDLSHKDEIILNLEEEITNCQMDVDDKLSEIYNLESSLDSQRDENTSLRSEVSALEDALADAHLTSEHCPNCG